MAKYGTKDVGFFLVDGYNLIGVSTSLADSTSAEMEETTGLGDSWAEQTATGVRSAELTADGFYDDASDSVNAALSVMLPAVPASRARLLPAVAIAALNKMLPADPPVESMSTAAASVTARVKVMLSSEVSTSPDVVSVPDFAAPNVTAPPALISPAAAIVVTPVESMATVPEAVIAALSAIVDPAS